MSINLTAQWVSLERLNELRFAEDPQAIQKLQRWCRAGRLPARRMGREWQVNLTEFDAEPPRRKTREDRILDRAMALLQSGGPSR